MSYLNLLIGNEVKNVSMDTCEYFYIDEVKSENSSTPLSVEEINLGFDSYNLAIINQYELTGVSELSRLTGLKISRVLESSDSVLIDFSGTASLRIKLEDSAYNGPEAMVLTGPNNLIVVWD